MQHIQGISRSQLQLSSLEDPAPQSVIINTNVLRKVFRL
jgi:hypothetical protein